MMRRCVLCVAVVLVGCVGLRAQEMRVATAADDPQITLYTGGWDELIHTLTPFDKREVFKGYVYDGYDRVTQLQWPEFVTLRMRPGVHTFSASKSSHEPADNSQQTLLMERGKHYFLLVELNHQAGETILVPVPFVWIVPMPVPNPTRQPKGAMSVEECEAAHRSFTARFEQRAQHVDPAYQFNLVPGVPSCGGMASAAATE